MNLPHLRRLEALDLGDVISDEVVATRLEQELRFHANWRRSGLHPTTALSRKTPTRNPFPIHDARTFVQRI